MKKLLILILMIVTFGFGAVHNANGVDRSAVLAAISASTDGDSVYIPAGSSTWSSGINVTKGIRIGGAGKDTTIIKISGGSYIFRYQPATPIKDSLFSINKMTLDCDSISGISAIILTHTGDYNYVNNIRIVNCRITNTSASGTAYALYTLGNVNGVMSNCRVDSCPRAFRFLGDNDNSWHTPLVVGSSGYFYVEQCSIWTYSGTTALLVSSGWGCKWVFRYNWVDLSIRGFNVFDAHGNLSSVRGNIGHAIYENTFVNAADRSDGMRWHDLRGGTAQVYNNTVTGLETSCVLAIHEEDCDNIEECIDNEYPGIDPVIDSYVWGNSYNAAAMTVDNINSNHTIEMLLEDRDWWDDIGVGDNNFTYGLFASRPATCAVNDCYYATDTKVLYRSIEENQWDSVYAEFSYPHPLLSRAAAQSQSAKVGKIWVR